MSDFFTLNIPCVSHDGQLSVHLHRGDTLFVLGSNGTGKSSLLQRCAQSAQGLVKRISASRQTWLQSSDLEFSPAQKVSIEQQARNWDNNQQSRWMEQNAQFRSGLTLFDLMDAENVDARAIAQAVRSNDEVKVNELKQRSAPLAKLNELLALSNLPIKISVEGGSRLVASKNGSPSFGAAELSDGERNALLIAADVLTAKPGSLLIIDEPERHLHRSIISPLLTLLFREQKECAFIVATHDLMLPVDNPEARTLLVRSCNYSGSYAVSWDVDIIPANADIGEALKQDIVGARRRIVFVEGDEHTSLDKPLYNLIFPNVSVRAKGSSRDVENAVRGLKDSEDAHWVKAWGIIDNDGRDAATISALEADGIYALPLHSVESIYYHPAVTSQVARRQASVTGGDGEINGIAAINAALECIKPHVNRMAARSVEKNVRRQIFDSLPTLRSINQREPINIQVDTAAIIEAQTEALNQALNESDWNFILSHCPVRETPALDAIARAVGLRDRHQYESAVL